MDHWAVIASERVALADQLDTLTPDQWATQSLCSAWTVHDVVAHLVLPHKKKPRFELAFTAAIVAARGNFDRANNALTAKEARRPTNELVAALRSAADSRFRPPGFGSAAPLTDILVHGQDIRIPLHVPCDRPIGPWRVALDLAVTTKVRRAFGNVSPDGLRFVATDLDWSYGTGDEVRGPAIALALAISHRDARMRDLTGPGLTVMQERMTT